MEIKTSLQKSIVREIKTTRALKTAEKEYKEVLSQLEQMEKNAEEKNSD